jgi:hypothetical protein
MSDDLDFDLDDDDTVDEDTASLDSLYPTGEEIETKPVAAEKPSLDTDALGGLITGALGAQSKQTNDLIEGLASKFLSQSAPTPKTGKTPEQIAESNMRISTLLATGGSGVDLEEELGKLVAPRIQAAIQSEIERVTPYVKNLHDAGGEEIVEIFKSKLSAGKSTKLAERVQAEVDKLILPSNYSWLASLSGKERKETLARVDEQVHGRIYKAALAEKGSRGASSGSTSGSASATDTALHAMPKSQQNEVRKFAEALTRQHGHAAGTPAYNKSVQRYIKEYLEDNTQ